MATRSPHASQIALILLRSAGVALGLLVGGCSLAVDADRAQCSSDGDCTSGPQDADGLPSTRAAATDREGSGGFVNAPAGPFTVLATLAGSNVPLASATILIRPGFISHGRLVPAMALQRAELAKSTISPGWPATDVKR